MKYHHLFRKSLLLLLPFLLTSLPAPTCATVIDTSISGGPPSTEITLFGPPADGAATTPPIDTSGTPDDMTTGSNDDGVPIVIMTDADGNFQIPCQPGERYSIPRGEGLEPDTFICKENGSICLADASAITRPVIRDMPANESIKAKGGEMLGDLAKGFLGIGGGSPFGSSGSQMVNKPRGTWTNFTAGDTELALNGWLYRPRSKAKEPQIRIAMQISESPDKGAPHTMMLQNQNGEVLWPIGYMVFELWMNWKLTITVTRETYIDGELVSRSVSRSSYAWKELMDRYAAIIKAPAIWEQLGGDDPKAFSKLRGVIVQFPLSESFNPEQWSLVTHVTSKAKQGEREVLKTVPFVVDISQGKKNNLAFTQAAGGRSRYQISHDCP